MTNWVTESERLEALAEESRQTGKYIVTATQVPERDIPEPEEFRELAKFVEVDEVRPIEGADAIEAVVVGGWTVVCKKGEFKVGDSAVYIEVDAMLPMDDKRFEFLKERGVRTYEGREYHRLKTVRLRGQISQGLLLPIDSFGLEVLFGTPYRDHPVLSLTQMLKILKYDETLPISAQTRADSAGAFPTYLGSKTDAERVQNLKGNWDRIKAEKWYATEKIDGTSLSVFKKDGELIVCSRNWRVKDTGNVYWQVVHAHEELFALMPDGFGIQGEIYGEGVQKNPLGLKGIHLGIFNYLDHGKPVMVFNWPSAVKALSVPGYVIPLPETLEEAIAQADGIKSQISPQRLAEGIVWTNAEGKQFPWLGNRHVFKVISNKYLLKHDG
jgi:RNA ligase (TIGR02306 family)